MAREIIAGGSGRAVGCAGVAAGLHLILPRRPSADARANGKRMTHRTGIRWGAAPLLAGALLNGIQTRAADYPIKPIKIVVPFPAGSASDLRTRKLAEQLGPKLGQPIIVENRPGAAGTIGAGVVARSAPDGYTLLYATNSILSVAPACTAAFRFRPVERVRGHHPSGRHTAGSGGSIEPAGPVAAGLCCGGEARAGRPDLRHLGRRQHPAYRHRAVCRDHRNPPPACAPTKASRKCSPPCSAARYPWAIAR